MVELVELTLKSLIIAVIAIAFDLLIHFFFSEPFETLEYFGFKFLIAFIVAFVLYGVLSETRLLKALHSIIFASVFHIIYSDALVGGYLNINRATEAFGITGFFEVGTIFFIVHAIGFYIGLTVADEL